MRKISRRAAWASSLAFLILISYVTVAQAQMLDGVRERLSNAKAEKTEEVRERQQEMRDTVVENRAERREEIEERTAERREELETRRSEMQETIEERREDARTRMEEKRLEMQENRQERRAHITEVHAERLESRFTFYGDRLADIISRLDTRLESLDAAGQDVTNQQEQLLAAQALLVEAENTTVDAIIGFLDVDPESYEEQRSAALAAGNVAQAARSQFEAVRSTLLDIIQSLKTESMEE